MPYKCVHARSCSVVFSSDFIEWLCSSLAAMLVLVDFGSGPWSRSAPKLGGPSQVCRRHSRCLDHTVRRPSPAGFYFPCYSRVWIKETEGPRCSRYSNVFLPHPSFIFIVNIMAVHGSHTFWFLSADPPIGDQNLSALTRTNLAIQRGEALSVVRNQQEILCIWIFFLPPWHPSHPVYCVPIIASEPEAPC